MIGLKGHKIIGIAASGPGAGKDTLFGLLKKDFGHKVVNVKFADALTEKLVTLFTQWNPEELRAIRNDPVRKDRGFYSLSCSDVGDTTYRDYLQQAGWDMMTKRSLRWHMIQYGTSFIREAIGLQDQWLDAGMERVRAINKLGGTAIITDVRMPNELAAIKAAGGLMVYVQGGPKCPRRIRAGGTEGQISQLDCHITVQNIQGEPERMKKQLYANTLF